RRDHPPRVRATTTGTRGGGLPRDRRGHRTRPATTTDTFDDHIQAVRWFGPVVRASGVDAHLRGGGTATAAATAWHGDHDPAPPASSHTDPGTLEVHEGDPGSDQAVLVLHIEVRS